MWETDCFDDDRNVAGTKNLQHRHHDKPRAADGVFFGLTTIALLLIHVGL